MGEGDMERRDPIAGWYADPFGGEGQRYWDGSSWTDQVRGSGASLLAGTTEADVTQQQPSAGGRAADTAAIVAGWYEDPLGEADYRYHDGAVWTTHIRAAPVAAAPDAGRGRLPLGALLIAGVFSVLAIGGITVVVLQTGGDEPTLAGDGTTDGEVRNDDAHSGTGSDELADEDGDVVDSDAEPDADADPDPDPDADPDADPDPATDGDGASTTDEDRTVLVDFDGACEAEVPVNELQQGTVRAWHVGCASAPVDLLPDESRWIIVVASLNGADFDDEDASARAAEVGLSDQVLWSSHYPSLNPELWVVYDGPFASEDAANDAAVDRADGSYPRVLSDDDGDRYCNAADGCRGETR